MGGEGGEYVVEGKLLKGGEREVEWCGDPNTRLFKDV